MNQETKGHLMATNTWKRGLFMLLFAVLYSVAEMVAFALIILQFLIVLLTGQPNSNLLSLGKSLSIYIYQLLQFLTFENETQPFPFQKWPKHLEEI